MEKVASAMKRKLHDDPKTSTLLRDKNVKFIVMQNDEIVKKSKRQFEFYMK